MKCLVVQKNIKKISKEDQTLIEIFKALSHQTRFHIIKVLLKSKKCMGQNFFDSLPYAQSTVSQHLQVLKKSGLIVCETLGTQSCYRLNEKHIRHICFLFENFFSQDKS